MIISPCISICKTDPVTGYCYGCGRNENDKKKVIAVTYDTHDQAVIKTFHTICNSAKDKFDKNSKIFFYQTHASMI